MCHNNDNNNINNKGTVCVVVAVFLSDLWTCRSPAELQTPPERRTPRWTQSCSPHLKSLRPEAAGSYLQGGHRDVITEGRGCRPIRDSDPQNVNTSKSWNIPPCCVCVCVSSIFPLLITKLTLLNCSTHSDLQYYTHTHTHTHTHTV